MEVMEVMEVSPIFSPSKIQWGKKREGERGRNKEIPPLLPLPPSYEKVIAI
jgi:hypothetical protein